MRVSGERRLPSRQRVAAAWGKALDSPIGGALRKVNMQYSCNH